MTADNVLYIKVGDKVTIIDNVDFTKAVTTEARTNQKAIGIAGNGVIDFAGYAQGVYTLDVVVEDDRAYEGIVVIGEQPQSNIEKVIKKETVRHVVDIDIEDDNDNDKCSNKEGSGGLGFPQEHLTECEVEEWDDCQKQPGGYSATERCDILHEIFHDDDCLGYASQEECDAAYDPELEPQPEPIGGGCFDGATPVNGECPFPPGHKPGDAYCMALGCPGSPPEDSFAYVELPPTPEPEPTDKGYFPGIGPIPPEDEVFTDGEQFEPELEEQQNGNEDEENGNDQSIIGDDDSDESEEEEQDEDESGESEDETEDTGSEQESGGESEEESGGN